MPARPALVRPTQLSFSTICDFYEACQDVSSHTKKMTRLKQFREQCLQRNNDELFEVYRLLLPQYDIKRGNFALKESKLAVAWSNACGFNPKTSAKGKSAVAWKHSSTKRAGNFSAVMYEHLFRLAAGKVEHEPGEKELKVEDLNSKLDELAIASSAEEKTAVLQWLVQHSSARMLTWITHVILKDLKIGISEKSILRDFHPDAEDLYNVTMDLSAVCNDLKDRNKRMPRRDVTPGHPVRPQLASAARSPEEAFKRMKNKSFVVETKFDGERMQLHRNGDEIHYFSRNGKEHGEYSGYDIMDVVIKNQLKHEKCILDGEMIVWNKTRKVFEPFGGLKSAFTLARDGKSVDTQIQMTRGEGLFTTNPDYIAPLVGDIEIVFIAFDILFIDEESVINLPLLERQTLLKAAIAPPTDEGYSIGRGTMQGRVAKLMPNEPLLDHTVCSKICHTMEDIQNAFDEAIRIQEEGIIVKALDSPWQMNDRSGAWLKIKPDYVHSNDIDAVIIGAFNGTGRHGGQVTQWLLALAQGPAGGCNANPSVFLSFCKVGTGISDAELKTVRDRLEPYFTTEKPKNYKVTSSRKVQPDVWIQDVSKSLVLQVQADVRTIISRDFATRHSLRFPRVERVRYDKSPFDVQTDGQLWELVNQNKGALVGGEEGGPVPQPRYRGKKKTDKMSPQQVRKVGVVEHFLPTDVSSIKKESDILKGCKVQLLNYGSHSRAEMEALVAKLGGTVYQHWTKDVTHIVAAQKDVKFHAHVKHERDVVSLEWLLECSQIQQLIPIKPHHYLHLSKKTLQEVPDVDSFGDLYYMDSAPCDIQAVLENHCSLGDIDISRLPRLAKQKDSSPSPPSTPTSSEAKQIAMRTPLEVIMDVEVELGLHGQADPSASLFRGCSVCLVSLPGRKPAGRSQGSSNLFQSTVTAMQAAAASQQTLQDCQAMRVSLQVELHGGRVQSELTTETTHIMLLEAGIDNDIATPTDILATVSEKLGGVPALRHLKEGLSNGRIKLVKQSWLEASLLALHQHPADASRVNEVHHLASISPPHATLDDVNTSYRSEEWPWAVFGVADAPPSEKKKSAGHRKRGASPASETASHASTAQAAQGEEASKPAAKRGKRAAGVGSAKVIRRAPPKRGKATAIGGSTGSVHKPRVPEQQPAQSSHDAAASQPGASGDVAISQQDVDWLPSNSDHQAQTVPHARHLPQRKTRLRSRQSFKGAEGGLVEEAAPLPYGTAETDHDRQTGWEQLDQGTTAAHVMPGRSHHKQQVIEDDDIMLEQDQVAGQASSLRGTTHAADAPALDLDDQDTAAKAATETTERNAPLCDGLSHASDSQIRHKVTAAAAQKPRPAAHMSLLDAMMDDDDYGFGEPIHRAEPEHAMPLHPFHTAGVGAELEQKTTLPSPKNDVAEQQQVVQKDTHLQRHDALPGQPADTAEQLPRQIASSAPRKGSLRDKMRALGMKV